MKRELPPFQLALFLVLGCVIFRLVSGAFPEAIPNVSPLLAIALVGGLLLPARWGWLVGTVALLITDLAFLPLNYLTDGSGTMFSGFTVLSLVLYAAIGGLGVLLARNKSLPRIVGGSLACSLSFYLASNTFSWWHDFAVGLTPHYALTLAGWWQANTVGLPGYLPTWTFLRNAMVGDLFFVLVLLFVLDRGLFSAEAPVRSVSSA